MLEADVKHIVALYPYSKFKILREAFLITAPSGVELAGLCIKPIRDSPEVDSGLFTNGFEIVMVGWNPPGSGTGGQTTPGTLHMLHASNYVPPAPNPDDPDGTVPPTAAAVRQNSLTNHVELDSLGGWIQFRYYDDTTEFEYAFIDIQTFEYLAGETSNQFYNKNASDEPINPATNATFNPETQRGILLSRAFITMHDGTEYKRFRGLRMYPHPEPKIPLDAAGRNSLAYYIGSTCPPYWYDEGIVPTADGAGEDMNTQPPVMLLTKQVTNPPPKKEDCNYVINHINKVALHAELVKQGLVSKEPPPVYKVRIWPWILLAALLILLAIIGIIDVVRDSGLLGKKIG